MPISRSNDWEGSRRIVWRILLFWTAISPGFPPIRFSTPRCSEPSLGARRYGRRSKSSSSERVPDCLLDRSASDLWVNLFPKLTLGGLDLSGAFSRERLEALVQYAVVEVRLAWPVPGSLSVM